MRTSWLVKLVAVAGLVIIFTLAGCAKASPAPAPTPVTTATPEAATAKPVPATTPKEPYGDLRIAVTTLGAQRFDPIKSTDYTGQGMNSYPMMDPILWQWGGETKPWVAERWEVAKDGLAWTLYIRKGIKFHNGADLTAADVKHSLERLAKEGIIFVVDARRIQRIELVDDYTLRLDTKVLEPFLPFILLQRTLVTPKGYIEQYGSDYFGLHPVGSGPFRFVKAVLGDVSEYEAMDTHWARPAVFKRLSVIRVPEESTKVAMLRTGEVDIIDVEFENAEILEKLGFKTKPFVYCAGGYYFWGAYEARGKGMPIQDLRVRQALSLAINRQAIMDLYKGRAKPPLPMGFYASYADFDAAYWQDAYAKANPYDPAEAKRLLKEAGYPDGFKLKFWYSPGAGRAFFSRWAEIVANDWRQIGVTAEVALIEVGTYTLWRPHPCNIGFVGTAHFQVGPEYPGSSVTPTETVSNAFIERVFDQAPFAAELDKLILAAKSEMDAAKRKELTAQIIKIENDSYVRAQIGAIPMMLVAGPRVSLDEWPPPHTPYTATWASWTKHAK